MDGLTSAGRPASAIDIPIGRSAPGPCAGAARAVARASEEDAVLIANPADQAIYFYKEGLSAPQGSFRGYGHAPIAVLAVDRSLRPAGPGEFSTIARLRRTGRFDLAVFLDSPRIVHCFEIDIADDPQRPPQPPAVVARLVDVVPPAIVGRPSRVRLKLEERGSGRPIADKPDVRVLATLPGRWQHAFPAPAQADAGTYAFDFTPPRVGLYALYVEGQARGAASQSPQVLYVEVKEPTR
jgi:hypothetical protein